MTTRRRRCGPKCFGTAATYATIDKDGGATRLFPAAEVRKMCAVAASLNDSMAKLLTAAAAINGTRIEFDGQSHGQSKLTADQERYSTAVCSEFGGAFGYPEYWDAGGEAPYGDVSLGDSLTISPRPFACEAQARPPVAAAGRRSTRPSKR